MPDRLLYPVFEALRAQGVSLGVSEYMVAVEALRAGLHVETPDRLRRLLRLLWAKSQDDLALVDTAFLEKVAPLFAPAPELSAGKAGKDDVGEASVSDAPSPESGPEPKTVDVDLEQHAQRLPGSDRTGHPGAPPRPPGAVGTVRRFRFSPRPPLDRRSAARAFQRLRRPLRQGESPFPDPEATVAAVCRDGWLTRPVMAPNRVSRVELLLFVDWGGSMTPFLPLLAPLFEALEKDALSRRVHRHYFHDCPKNRLYRTPGVAQPVDLASVLRRPPAGVSGLIVSDAGAARGDYDGRRLADTHAFLKRLYELTPRVAWLNPAPEPRWAASTAQGIRQEVAMFPLTRAGVEGAVRVLRGRAVGWASSQFGRRAGGAS